MAFTNFPQGVMSFGAPIVPPYRTGFLGQGTGTSTTPGPIQSSQHFFVNSANPLASDGNFVFRDPLRPMKTINKALTYTVNNNGDIIWVGPGHVETVASAGALTFPTATAAGVMVVFLGNEADRAQINFTTATTASVTIPASNVRLVGARFLNSIDALAAGLSITGSDVVLQDCEWLDGSATNTLIGPITTNAAKRLSIIGYRYYDDQVGGGTQKTEHIRIVGGDHHRFEDVHITGDFTTGCWNNVTTATVEALMLRCTFNNLNATPHVGIACTTSTTGMGLSVLVTVASGSTWITASHKMSFDMASGGVIPGGTQALLH